MALHYEVLLSAAFTAYLALFGGKITPAQTIAALRMLV